MIVIIIIIVVVIKIISLGIKKRSGIIIIDYINSSNNNSSLINSRQIRWQEGKMNGEYHTPMCQKKNLLSLYVSRDGSHSLRRFMFLAKVRVSSQGSRSLQRFTFLTKIHVPCKYSCSPQRFTFLTNVQPLIVRRAACRWQSVNNVWLLLLVLYRFLSIAFICG